jgi:hypothetical protein
VVAEPSTAASGVRRSWLTELSKAERSLSERRRASASAASAANSARSSATAPWSSSEATKRAPSSLCKAFGSTAATPDRARTPCSGR